MSPLSHTQPCPNDSAGKEVVGSSPPEKVDTPPPPHVEDGESECVLDRSSIRSPLIHNCPLPHSPYSGPSSFPLPTTYFHLESATAHQHRPKDFTHVPRPRNAYIIYRCDYTQRYLANGGSKRAPHSEKWSLSKMAGDGWKNETPETVRHYQALAEEEKARW